MMRRRLIAALFAALLASPLASALIATPAAAQGCGPQNPNCIVPTRPPGTNDGTAASTAFVHGAIGSSGTVTSVAAGCGSTTFGPPITSAGTIAAVETVNPQTGTTYAINNTDCGSLTTFTNAAAIAVSLGQAGGGGNFISGWYNDLCDLGAGTATITPAVSTINGVATLVLSTGKCARIVSDGVNYQVITYGGGGGGAAGGTNKQFQYNNSTAFAGANVWFTSANQVDHSNGVTAQAVRIYNLTDNNGGTPTNGEWLTFDWTTNTNVFTIATAKSGTGSNRGIFLSPAGSNTNVATGGGYPSFSFINGNFGVSSSFVVDAGNSLIKGTNGSAFGWTASGTADASLDTSLSRATAKVASFGDGGTNANGWLNWAGEARLDADFSATSNTTLANVTGTSHSLTVSLLAGRNYIFEISLPMVTGATAGGIKIALGGTATITNLIADGICMDGPTAALISTTRVAALTTAIVATTNAGTTPKCTLSGTFEVNAAGTFTVQFAQNASSATASTVKRGAYMFVNDAP